MDVLAGDEGDPLAVGAPREDAELAGIFDPRLDGARVRGDHPQPLLHHPVVHARCGRDRDQEAFIHRRPAHGADVALDREGDGRGFLRQRGDPDPLGAPVLLVDLGPEPLVAELPQGLIVRLARDERHAFPVGGEAVIDDVGSRREHPACLPATQRDRIKTADLVLPALGKERDVAPAGQPAHEAHVDLAADIGSGGAARGRQHPQLGPWLAVLLLARAPRDGERVR